MPAANKKSASVPASSMLKSLAKPFHKTQKGRKSDIPALLGHEKTADALHEAVKAANDAKAEQASLEEDLLPVVGKEYRRLASDNQFTKSINIPGDKTEGVQITYQDKFVPIPIEHETELRAMDPKFDEHFEQKRSLGMKRADHDAIALLMKKLGKNITDLFSISLNDTSDEAINLLVAKLGQDTFAEMFNVELTLVAKEGLDRKVHELPKTDLIRQYKGAVKLRASK